MLLMLLLPAIIVGTNHCDRIIRSGEIHHHRNESVEVEWDVDIWLDCSKSDESHWILHSNLFIQIYGK
jgi:hypothetical protein